LEGAHVITDYNIRKLKIKINYKHHFAFFFREKKKQNGGFRQELNMVEYNFFDNKLDRPHIEPLCLRTTVTKGIHSYGLSTVKTLDPN